MKSPVFILLILISLFGKAQKQDSAKSKLYLSAGIIGGINKNAGGYIDTASNKNLSNNYPTKTITATDKTDRFKRNIGAKLSLKYKYKKVTFSFSSYLMYCESQFTIHHSDNNIGISHSYYHNETINVSNYIMLNQNELCASVNFKYFYFGLALTANSELIKNYSANKITTNGGYSVLSSSPSTYTNEPYKFINYENLNYLSYSLFLSVPIKPIKSVVFVRLNSSKLYNHFMLNLGFEKNFYFKKRKGT